MMSETSFIISYPSVTFVSAATKPLGVFIICMIYECYVFDKTSHPYSKINANIATRLDCSSSTIYCGSSLSATLTEVRNNEGMIQARSDIQSRHPDGHRHTWSHPVDPTEPWFGLHQPLRIISGPLAVRLSMTPVIWLFGAGANRQYIDQRSAPCWIATTHNNSCTLSLSTKLDPILLYNLWLFTALFVFIVFSF